MFIRKFAPILLVALAVSVFFLSSPNVIGDDQSVQHLHASYGCDVGPCFPPGPGVILGGGCSTVTECLGIDNLLGQSVRTPRIIVE